MTFYWLRIKAALLTFYYFGNTEDSFQKSRFIVNLPMYILSLHMQLHVLQVQQISSKKGCWCRRELYNCSNCIAYLYGGRDTPGTLATRYVPQDTLVTRLYENIEAIRYNPGIQPGNYLLCCPSWWSNSKPQCVLTMTYTELTQLGEEF